MPNDVRGSGTGGSPSLVDTRKALLALRERQRSVATGAAAGITPAARGRALPLSFAQQRLWFLDRWSTGQPVYNAPVVVRLPADLDVAALQRALRTVVARHEVLRTRYPSQHGVAYQHIDPAPEQVPLTVRDFSASTDPERAAAEFVLAEVRKPFDLSVDPAIRASLARVDRTGSVLVLAMHHIATDGWSTAILIRELIELYQAELDRRTPFLPDLPVQYADYAVWQRSMMAGDGLDQQLAYWRERLADLPTMDLPTDRPRPAEPTRAGATLEVLLPSTLQQDLHRLALDQRVTLLAVVLAAFTAMMSRYTGQDDVVLGSIFSGRTRPEIEHLIGFFSNTLVLRTSTAGDPSFRELLARANDTVLGAHFNQDLPFGRLVEELSPERDPSRNPLFQTCFTLQHAAADSARVGDVEAESCTPHVGTARFDLAVQLTEVPERGLRLWAEYSTELYDAARIARMFGHYERILCAVAAEPGLRLSELPMLADSERRRLTTGWNDTRRDHGHAGTRLHELFEAAVDRGPHTPALRFDGEVVDYRQLDERANQVARALREAGVTTEAVIGVLAERGPGLPVAFLGVHKAGGACLPLDPDQPPARWDLMLTEAAASMVVTTTALAGALPANVIPICLDGPAVLRQPTQRLSAVGDPRSLAYTIFTSGSTGRPKGVQVEHRSIVNYTRAIIDQFRLGPGDRVLQFANPVFDVSLFDFFSALCSGATLVQARRATLLDPVALTELMRAERVTVTDLPPAVLGLLDPAHLPDLRALYVGLEAFRGELVNRWNTAGREFHNGYGPTEATVACVNYRCPPTHHDAMPPIGVPMANYQAYVVDRFGHPTPIGVPGELLIGGAGVARGYLNQPGLTGGSFVPDAFGATGGRLYRTGDLVRWRDDGNLEFLGRLDRQVKVRGLRIEPSEIEHAMTGHPGVAEAAVVVHGSGAQAQLVGYLTAVAGVAFETDDLRAYLHQQLPSYLVPTAFVLLPEFPRGDSGKLDRSRLPQPDGAAGGAEPEPPSTPTQLALAEIWRDILSVAELGIHDDFFGVGGNSLKVTQLAARIHDQFGLQVELRDLFVNPTIAKLAGLIEARELGSVDDAQLLALLSHVEQAGEPDRRP